MIEDIQQIINAVKSIDKSNVTGEQQNIYHTIYLVREVQKLFAGNDDFMYRLFVAEKNFIIIHELLNKYNLMNKFEGQIKRYINSNNQNRIDNLTDLIDDIEEEELKNHDKSLRIYE